jgi:hypothetical protein
MILTHAVDSRHLIKSLTTNIAELFLVMNRLRPAMCDGIFCQKWSNSRARRDDIRDTFFMHNKIAHYKEREREKKITIEEYYWESRRERERMWSYVLCIYASMSMYVCHFPVSLSLSSMCWSIFFPWKCGRMTSTKTACISSCQWHAHDFHYFLYTKHTFYYKKKSFFAFFHLLYTLSFLSHSLADEIYQDLQPSFDGGVVKCVRKYP